MISIANNNINTNNKILIKNGFKPIKIKDIYEKNIVGKINNVLSHKSYNIFKKLKKFINENLNKKLYIYYCDILTTKNKENNKTIEYEMIETNFGTFCLFYDNDYILSYNPYVTLNHKEMVYVGIFLANLYVEKIKSFEISDSYLYIMNLSNSLMPQILTLSGENAMEFYYYYDCIHEISSNITNEYHSKILEDTPIELMHEC